MVDCVKEGLLDAWINNPALITCPFMKHEHDRFGCLFEGSSVKLDKDLYFELNEIDLAKLNCKCMAQQKEFLTCPTFQKAFNDYKTKSSEFLALYNVLYNKAAFDYDKRKGKDACVKHR
jgi:hypothetical protein